MDMKFPRGRGAPSRKIMENPGVGGLSWSPLEQKILGGGGKLEKTSVGGMNIFWNHTMVTRWEGMRDVPHKENIFSNFILCVFIWRLFLACCGFVNMITFWILSVILLGRWVLVSIHLITFSWNPVDAIYWGLKLCTHLICFICFFFFYKWNSWIDPVSLS